MTVVVQSTHDRLVRETAERYIRQGFPVQIQPQDADLPTFLQGFQPDMIVTTPEEKIVVAVKTRGIARGTKYWERLQNAVAQQKGWKFRLALDNQREEELSGIEEPVLSDEQIEAQLQASRLLAERGVFGGALVVVWSTLEAILRKASREQGLQLPNQGPGPLVTTLYTEGNLDREDYEALMQSLRARNQAAHGFHNANIDRSLVEHIQQIAQRLMTNAAGAHSIQI